MIFNFLMYTGLRWIWISLLILFFDFFSKKWIKSNFYYTESVKLFSFLNFIHIENYGSAFNLLENLIGWKLYFFCFLNVIIIAYILLTMHRINCKFNSYNLVFSMFVGGGLGNLLDRIYYKKVIDFIDLHIASFHIPTFNIADLSIFFGITITIINFFLIKRNKN